MQDEILNLIQKEFPVTKRPFQKIAQKVGSSEDEVLDIYKKLKNDKIIRQTSAIFDTKSLGYKSSLVAFMVDDIENAAKIINTHPGVSHNYERDHQYNLWFTIAIAPNSKLDLEKTIEILAQKTKAKDYLILPTKKMFKIKVTLDVKGDRAKKEKVSKKKVEKFELTPYDYELIKYLQKDIEPIYEPFQKIVKNLNISYEELENSVKKLQNGGYLRRFASILYHRRVGFKANAMVVWELKEDSDAQKIGYKVAEFSKVSHCYLRPTFKNWPYSLFSMIHAKSKEEIDEVVEEIAKEIDPKSYAFLYSTKEFKKQRIEYFSDDFERWEEDNIPLEVS